MYNVRTRTVELDLNTMYFRIISCFLPICLLLLFHVCIADESHIRSKRDDESNGFGQMFSEFLTSLFGPNTTQSSFIDSLLNETAQPLPANMSASPNEEENVTDAGQTSHPTEITSQANGTSSLGQVSNAASSNFSTESTATISSSASSDSTGNVCNDVPMLRNFCQVPGNMYDVSFWDLYSIFFSDRVINALLAACPVGSWCLQDEYWESIIEEQVSIVTGSSSIINMICETDFEPCLLYIVNSFENCSKYTDFMVTFEALKLVCDLKRNTDLSSSCYTHMFTALHVTLADHFRSEEELENYSYTCQSTKVNMMNELICVENACPGESETIYRFDPWAWFSMEDNLIIDCGLNTTQCGSIPASTNANDTETDLQAQLQEVTSQETSQFTTTRKGSSGVSSTAFPSSSSYFSSSSTWMYPGTDYPLEDDRCYTDVILQNFCPVPEDMTDVSFWDLYSVFFSDTVLDALMVSCSKGSWCLQDRFDYWESLIVERVDIVMESEIASSMCSPQIEPCLLNVATSFSNCSMYSQMIYTSEVLNLICGLKQNPDLTSDCYKHVISALHVTLADILRKEDYTRDEDADTCESPEAEMTKGLICVENSCPYETSTFQSFKPWAWFTSVVNDLIDDCDFDPTVCKALLTPPPGYMRGNEFGTLIGISVATMVTALTLTVVVCTCYKRHRRNAVVKEGYQRLLTDGDDA